MSINVLYFILVNIRKTTVSLTNWKGSYSLTVSHAWGPFVGPLRPSSHPLIFPAVLLLAPQPFPGERDSLSRNSLTFWKFPMETIKLPTVGHREANGGAVLRGAAPSYLLLHADSEKMTNKPKRLAQLSTTDMNMFVVWTHKAFVPVCAVCFSPGLLRLNCCCVSLVKEWGVWNTSGNVN